MSEQKKIALVTGANRGIGFEICRGLLNKDFHVLLSARNLEKAEQAAEKLRGGAGNVTPVALDVSSDESILSAVAAVRKICGRVDVLINNGAIYPDEGYDILTIEREQLHRTFDINTFGPIILTQAMMSLLEKSENARVIHISSGYGQLGGMTAKVPSYCLSKLTLNGVTIMHQQMLPKKGISVFVMSPGWVHTEMGGPEAPRTPQQGADTAIWLATEASQTLSGKFFEDREPVSW